MQIPALQGLDSPMTSPIELARLLYRNKLRILGLTLSCGVIGALYAYTQQPTYRAAATVLIEPRENRAVQLQEAYDPGVDTGNYLMTQLGILRSRALAAKVVDRLDLLHTTEFGGKQPGTISQYWGEKLRGMSLQKWLPVAAEGDESAEPAPPPKAEGPVPLDQAEQDERTSRAIDQFLSQMIPLSIPKTQLIQINFTANSPELAAKAANSLADAYIEYGLEARLDTSKKATHWLNDKLADIATNLQKSEKQLQEFREKSQIVNVGGSRGLLGDELIDNSKRLREAQRTRTELSSTYAKIQQAGTNVRQLEQISELLRQPLVQNSKSNLLSALDSLKQLQQRYGEKHPQLAGAITRVEAAERTFRDQLLLAAQNVRTEYEIARDNERALNGTVDTQKDQIRALDRKEYEQGVLERDVASNRQLYDTFLSSFKANDTSSSYEPINVRILEPAVPPTQKFEPSISKYLFNGLIVGMILGVGLVLLRHAMDETVHSPDELEALTGVPVISVVPKVSSGIVGSRKSLAQMFSDQPRTPFAEGIRSIRASLKLNDVDKSFKRILVTSAVPGEGKSSLASCLALAFGSGERALLIEADLRAPTVKKLFNLPKDRPGLMELLTGEATLEECLFLHEPTQTYVLPVAKSPANPAEVVNSAAFAKLVATLSERFDHVILDSPPCQAASDSLVLAKMADVVLFTTMADSTHKRAVSIAMKQLKQVQAHVIGCVLNQVDARKNSYYADSYYYARQYYG